MAFHKAVEDIFRFTRAHYKFYSNRHYKIIDTIYNNVNYGSSVHRIYFEGPRFALRAQHVPSTTIQKLTDADAVDADAVDADAVDAAIDAFDLDLPKKCHDSAHVSAPACKAGSFDKQVHVLKRIDYLSGFNALYVPMRTNPLIEIEILEAMYESNAVVKLINYSFDIDAKTERIFVNIFLEKASGDLIDLIDSITDKHELKRTTLFACVYICRALRELHSAGYAHLDIKPDNILIVNGKCVLCDFTMSKCIARDSEDTRCAGTREYIAPEVFFGAKAPRELGIEAGPYDWCKSDIWSLLIILYRLFVNDLNINDTSEIIEFYEGLKPLHSHQTNSMQLFTEPFNPHIGVDADMLAFIRDSLTLNPSERPSLNQIEDFILSLI